MHIKIVKPSSSEERHTRTTVDTVLLNQKLVASWKSPPFQRDLKTNSKVLEVSKDIASSGGVIPGVLTIGVLDGETYVVDGQHRLSAWQLTSLDYGYADVRTCWFESLGDMAREFVKLNQQLVRLKPDDILRGLESSTVSLQRIRRKCPFIGYDMIRRGDKAPIISMSMFVRTWESTRSEIPYPRPAMEAVQGMDDNETTHAIDFATLCYDAWSREPEFITLWASMNMTMCAWIYRRMVLAEHDNKVARRTKISATDFKKCLMALSADEHYMDYLVGRRSREHMSPTYARIKVIFHRRHLSETGKALKFPRPAWATTAGLGALQRRGM